MKKSYIILSLFLFAFILQACSNNDNQSLENDEVNGQDEEAQEESNDTEDSEEPEVDPEPTENDEDEDDMDEDTSEVIEDEEVEVKYVVNQSNWAVDPIDDADPKVVLITIDDVIDNYGLEMAQILKELDVPAIFYVNGHFLNTDEKQEKLREMHEMGFAIGNHTYNHPNLQEISAEEQEQQIVELNDLVEDIIGERPRFFRAPFGANTEDSYAISESEGMVVMNWTYGYDWEADYREADALADIMVNTELLRDGANVLMHDREWTKDALVDIIEGLREKGYSFVDPDTIQGVE